jgi:hypothetical protein
MSSNGSPAMPVRNRTLDCRSNFIQAAQAAVLVAIISVFLPTLAHAQPTVVDGPVNFTETNPCLAFEVVNVTGRQTFTTWGRFDGAGGIHLTMRFVTKGQGSAVVIPSQPPKEYVLNSESVFEMNVPANGTAEQTETLNHVLVRKAETDGTNPVLGSGEDFMLKQTVHITTHNGVPTATITNGHKRCM